jgi:pyruvate/2-oxoglutarate dehydrogenase complex dihydrolipoamide acyltransferase (E2) component
MTTENESPSILKFHMPKFEETSDSATIVKWLKQPGDRIGKGEALAEVETEKFTHPIESPVDGIIVELLLKEGEEAEIGALLATFKPLEAEA